MHQANILRIVVASPSDVQAERDALPGVVDELNRDIASERGLHLTITRWEDDAYAGFHPQGPQGLIDAILRIEDCDIFIGIFWKRFGTPVYDAKSGTAHEFQRAYEAWQQQRRPHIMMYFNQTPYTPQTSAEAKQWRETLVFREGFPKDGLWWPYQGEAEFARLVRRHLTQFIRQERRQSSGPPSPPDQSGTAASDSTLKLREDYLNWLIGHVRSVPLSGIDPRSIPDPTRQELKLAAVYTALMTERTESTADRDRILDRAQQRLSALATMGDPRFRRDAWYLLDEPLLGFVKVTAGMFFMGSDKGHDPEALDEEIPQHEVHLPDYFIGRYPVTVAQFRAFVADSGYRPENEYCLQGVPNHPVVNVTWYEARKYCHWLTERLRGWKNTPEPLAALLGTEGWEVGLPSEAEWEKAARGSDGRIYPWGHTPDPAQANSIDTGINRTSAVGCFPAGASPAGCLDVAGNVWEWTRSLWGESYSEPRFKYPYTLDEDREDLAAPETILRVLRGGAFDLNHWFVRCAFRFRDPPYYSYRNLGFRVVVRPCR